MTLCDVAITVRRDRRAEIDRVASAVSDAGVSVERVIHQIGAIYGRGDEGCLPAVRAVAGVETVRLAETVQLAPPVAGEPQ